MSRSASYLVIVVDDDPASRLIMTRILVAAGYRAECFESGEACLSAFDRLAPDAVCLDVTLPGMDGLETLDRIRARHPHLPVILLTASLSFEVAEGALRRGASDCLSKPLDRQKFEAAVANAVGQGRRGEPGRVG